MENSFEIIQVGYSSEAIYVKVNSAKPKSTWGEHVTCVVRVINYVPVLTFAFENDDHNFYVHLNFYEQFDTNIDWISENIKLILVQDHNGTETDRREFILTSNDSNDIAVAFANQVGKSFEYIEDSINFIYDNDDEWLRKS